MISSKIHVKQRDDGYQWKDPSCSSQSALLAIMQKAYRTGPVHRTTTDIVRNRWDLRKAGSIDNWQSCKNNAINLRKSLFINNVWSFLGGEGEWSVSVICFRRFMNNDLEKNAIVQFREVRIFVVAQFYPWFKFYFSLFWGMVIYDKFKTKGNKI